MRGLMKRLLDLWRVFHLPEIPSDIEEATQRVTFKVMCAPERTHVVSVGPLYRDDDWVIEVGIDPYSEETIALIREMVAPDRVVVTYQKRP
jgi:hypothetical protein